MELENENNKTISIANSLEQEIINNYQNQLKIGSEKELMIRFKVSRTTIRNSLSILINKGLLSKKQGKGYFICDQSLWNKLLSFKDKEVGKTNSKLIKIKLNLNQYFIENFNLLNENFDSFIKLRYKDNLMTKYSIIWYNHNLFRNLNFELIKNSFLKYIKTQNINLSYSYKKIIFSRRNKLDEKYLEGSSLYQYLPRKYAITFDDENNVVECSL